MAENITIVVNVDSSALADLEQNTLDAARSAGLTEDEYAALNNRLGETAKRVASLRGEQDRLIKRMKALRDAQKDATDNKDVEFYEKQWKGVRIELDKVEDELKDIDRAGQGAGKSGASAFGKFSKMLGGIGKLLGAIGLVEVFTQIVQAAKDFVVEAANMAPAIEAFDAKAITVLGDELERVAVAARQNATDLGLTESQYIDAAAAAADLLIPMGFTRKTAAGLSIDLVNLSGALSEWSAGGKTSAQVTDILQKALLGERDGLKGLGIAISEADVQQRLLAKGQDDLTGKLLEQAKAQATLELITEKSTDAQTAFANNSDTLIRQQSQLTAAYETIQEALARRMIPTLKTLFGIANDVADAFLQFIRVSESEQIENSRIELGILVQTLERLREESDGSAESQRRQQSIIDELNEKYGDLLGTAIDLESSNDDLRSAFEEVNTALERNVELAAKREEREELIAQQKELKDETIALEKAVVEADNTSRGFTQRLFEGLIKIIPGIGAIATGFLALRDFFTSSTTANIRLNRANSEQVEIAERLAQINQELADAGVADKLKEQSDAADDASDSNDDLSGTTKKAYDAAKEHARQLEREAREAAKLSKEVSELDLAARVLAVGGEDAIRGLQLLRDAEIEKLRARRAFQELEKQDAERAGQLITEINERYQEKITDIQKDEFEKRAQNIRDAIQREQAVLQNALDEQTRTLATSNLDILGGELGEISRLEERFSQGKLTYQEYQDELSDIEQNSAIDRLEIQQRFFDDSRRAVERAQQENAARVSELQEGGTPTDLERIELEKRLALTKEFEDEIIQLKTASAETQKAITQQKVEDEIEAEEEKKEKLTEITQTIADVSNTITGGIASFFESQKRRELAAAGDNAEERERIEREFARKQQVIALSNAIIQGSVATIRAFSDLGPIAGAVAALGLGITIATAIANINAQQFFEGTDFATARSDSDSLLPGRSRGRDKIPAMLHEGERVTDANTNARYFGDFNALESGKMKPGLVSRIAGIAPDLVERFLAAHSDDTSPLTQTSGLSNRARQRAAQILRTGALDVSAFEPVPDVVVIGRDYTDKGPSVISHGLNYDKMAKRIALEGNRAFWAKNSGFFEMLRDQQDSNSLIIQLLSMLTNGD